MEDGERLLGVLLDHEQSFGLLQLTRAAYFLSPITTTTTGQDGNVPASNGRRALEGLQPSARLPERRPWRPAEPEEAEVAGGEKRAARSDSSSTAESGSR